MESNAKALPPGHELERIAQLASTTVPTVRNYLKGAPGKPRISARIQNALRELGFVDTSKASGAEQIAGAAIAFAKAET